MGRRAGLATHQAIWMITARRSPNKNLHAVSHCQKNPCQVSNSFVALPLPPWQKDIITAGTIPKDSIERGIDGHILDLQGR